MHLACFGVSLHIVHSAQVTLHSTDCALCTLHHVLGKLNTVPIVYCTAHYGLCTPQCARSILCTFGCAICMLHTIHPAPYTLHSTHLAHRLDIQHTVHCAVCILPTNFQHLRHFGGFAGANSTKFGFVYPSGMGPELLWKQSFFTLFLWSADHADLQEEGAEGARFGVTGPVAPQSTLFFFDIQSLLRDQWRKQYCETSNTAQTLFNAGNDALCVCYSGAMGTLGRKWVRIIFPKSDKRTT